MEEKLFELKPLFVKDLSIPVFIVLILTTIFSVVYLRYFLPDLMNNNPFLTYMFFITDVPIAILIGYLIHKQSKDLKLTKYDIYEDRIEFLINSIDKSKKRILNFADIKKVFVKNSSTKNGINAGTITILTKTGNYEYLKNIDNSKIIYAMLQQKITT